MSRKVQQINKQIWALFWLCKSLLNFLLNFIQKSVLKTMENIAGKTLNKKEATQVKKSGRFRNNILPFFCTFYSKFSYIRKNNNNNRNIKKRKNRKTEKY